MFWHFYIYITLRKRQSFTLRFVCCRMFMCLFYVFFALFNESLQDLSGSMSGVVYSLISMSAAVSETIWLWRNTGLRLLFTLIRGWGTHASSQTRKIFRFADGRQWRMCLPGVFLLVRWDLLRLQARVCVCVCHLSYFSRLSFSRILSIIY